MMRALATTRRRFPGFTLIEMVIVIVITGIIVAMVAFYLRTPILNYFEVTKEAELTDTADTALRKMARDLRRALPNSVRTRNADTNCVEFMPTVAGGRYRSVTSGGATPGDPLNFNAADQTFDFFGALSPAPTAGDLIVVYNLGIDGSDAYRQQNIGTVQSVAGENITLTAATLFPFPSPRFRFQVISGSEQAITYVCSGGNLYRYVGGFAPAGGQYAIQTDPSASSCPTPPSGTPILAANVASCVFEYTPGVTTRNGLVSMRLTLTKDDASVTLYHEVHVDNVP